MVRGTFLTVVAVFGCGLPAFSNPVVARDSSQQTKKSNAKTTKGPAVKPQEASQTGCVDEQDGDWVLLNEQSRAIITHLLAEGFPAEGFAKHMGHKVTVRGTANSAGSSPTFKVRSIETISETCSAR